MNDDLKLPEIKNQPNLPLFPHRAMKIEYLLEFMEFNLRNIINIKAVRKNKQKYSVFVPFRI